MNSLLLGFYGIYLALVGYEGHTSEFVTEIESEKAFTPWLIALIVLGALHASEKTRPIVAPFTGLLLLTVALKPNTQKSIKNTYQYLTNAPITSLGSKAQKVVNIK
ncbi:MAG: hypothetical protein ACREHG_05410 [Candidatus Saccharimonadales bacterium]